MKTLPLLDIPLAVLTAITRAIRALLKPHQPDNATTWINSPCPYGCDCGDCYSRHPTQGSCHCANPNDRHEAFDDIDECRWCWVDASRRPLRHIRVLYEPGSTEP